MELLKIGDENSWEEFVDSQEKVPVGSLIGWKKTIEKTYDNCKPLYFFSAKEKITKVFPFFLVESKLFGNRIISQPFIDSCGPLGDFDKKFIQNVINEIKEKFKDIKHIEIRLNTFVKNYEKIESCLSEMGFKKESKRHQFILKLESEESLWGKFDRITRKAIKKAEKSELKLKEIINEEELKKFYELYLKDMRAFGTPQHSYDFFSNLLNIMNKNFRGLNCYKDGNLIGSLIVFYTKDYMYAAYNFSERNYLKYQPNDILYWEMIKWAIRKNIKYFDFGQTEINAEEGSHAAGIYKFKKKWLGNLYERPYFYLSFGPEEKISDKKKGYEKAIEIWKKTPKPLIKIMDLKICSQLAL
jgi:lipid II:glycine glycyltransferase (peptidoglycan interpeptide bridge formation enzyme)